LPRAWAAAAALRCADSDCAIPALLISPKLRLFATSASALPVVAERTTVEVAPGVVDVEVEGLVLLILDDWHAGQLERLDVRASATFDKVGDAWKVTTMELHVTGKVPGISPAEFEAAAQAAGLGCPISGALKGNVTISVHAQLA
jgi:hypothetical protein